MLQRLYILLVLLLCAGRSAAQSAPECYTSDTASPYAPVSTASSLALPCVPSRAPSSDFSRFYGRQENYRPDNSLIEPMYVHKTIKVIFHVMLPTVPGGPKVNYEDNPADKAAIQSIVDKMNDWLANVPRPDSPRSLVCGPCHITDSRFRVEMLKKADGSNDIRYHRDGLAWENIYSWGAAGPGTYNGSLNSYIIDPEGVLNIFLLYSSRPSAPVGGISLSPTEDIGTLFSGDNSTIPLIATTNYWRSSALDYLANNLLHEIGHTMGTHHTFKDKWGFTDETCDETRWDYLSDIFGTAATYSKECGLHQGAENVFMNYNPWGNYMSPLQIARWHQHAHFLGCRRYVYNTYPEDANHDHTGQGQYYPLSISSNQSWDFDIKLYTDIVVRSGSKLSIRCRVLMPYHSNIIVEPGAELEIDGGIITAHHDSTMWFGISVWGDASKSQDKDADQGLLTMKNGATISNAVRAVTIGDPVFQDNTRNGGIVRITDAHFINNRGGFQWNPYRNLAWEYKAGTWTRTRLQPNRGYITRSSFTVDDRISREPVGQVAFAGVDGVALSGCTFTSTMPYTPKGQRCLSGCPDNKAIASWNSSFLFDEWRPVSGSSVIPGYCSGFRQGILAASFSASNPFVVRNSVFENNQVGIATRGVNSFTINDNKFLIGNPATPGAAVEGLQLNSSSLYRVYGNQFGPVGSGTDVRIGAEVSEGGSDFNRIYNNSYASLYIGNLSNFQNSNGFYSGLSFEENKSTGLEFTCNTHSWNQTGVYVQGYLDAAGKAVDGIRRVQGSARIPAGNSFDGRFFGYFHIYTQQLWNSFATRWDYYTLPLDKYHYYDSDPAQDPEVSSNVYKFSTSFRNQCLLEAPFSGHTATPGSPEGAAEARIRLSDAYSDYNEGRFGRLDAALHAMGSPYAETERALLYMQEGRVAEGLGIYNAIAQLPLTEREQNDFAQGATLMRLLAARYSQNSVPRWDSLGTAEVDSLRSVREHSRMWARQRACAWLAYAAGEPCAIVLPELPDAAGGGSNMRRAQEEEALSLSLQPNPSTRDFELRYSAEQALELSVSDALGRSLYRAQLPAAAAGSYRIPAAAWESGVYLYRITGAGKTLYYGKLIKQ